jgi:CheY-like chemotaxis protein
MPQAQKRVLVVEDHVLMAELEAYILQDAGYEVEIAESGRVAIASLTQRRPDLVLLDIVMPGVNGWDVLRYLQRMPSPPPVIVASGLVEVVPPGPLSEFVVGYLLKPFRVDALLKMCEEVLAAPLVVGASGSRKESRRTYVVEATLLTPGGAPLMTGKLLQISLGGFRLEAIGNVEPGEPVFISVRIPGRDQPLELHGRVRWRNDVLMGVEMQGLTPPDEKLLRRFVDSEDSGPEGPRWHAPRAPV